MMEVDDDPTVQDALEFDAEMEKLKEIDEGNALFLDILKERL